MDRQINRDCFSCAHCVPIWGGKYICDDDMSILVIKNYDEPTDDFMCCDGKDWEEE